MKGFKRSINARSESTLTSGMGRGEHAPVTERSLRGKIIEQ
jgi:hypothetical protein